jgi:hypothetical protein
MRLNLVLTKNALIGQLVLVAQVGLAPFVCPQLVGLSFHAETGRMMKCSTLLWYNALYDSARVGGDSFWWVLAMQSTRKSSLA